MEIEILATLGDILGVVRGVAIFVMSCLAILILILFTK